MHFTRVPHVVIKTITIAHVRKLSTTSGLQGRSASATLRNLLINESTKVVYQGFTGKRATGNAIEAISYGTKVVGGVSRNKGGTRHLGLPVYETISQASKELQPSASLVYVPAIGAARAIEEAVEAEIPLIVCLAEHVPVHDMLRVHEVLATQTASRLLGPNCPGLISPRNKSRVGIIPTAQCMSGSVGVISRSGTMIYEVVGATGRVGLGQSLMLGLGGDMMPGTTMEEALEVMIDHDETEIIVLNGEIGGVSELRAAEAIRQYYSRFEAGSRRGPKKPIVAIISGRTAPEGKTMGHAGALLSPGEQGAEAKARALQNAGAIVLPHLGMLDSTLQRLTGDGGQHLIAKLG